MPTCRWLKHCLTGTPETMLTRTRTLFSILTALKWMPIAIKCALVCLLLAKRLRRFPSISILDAENVGFWNGLVRRKVMRRPLHSEAQGKWRASSYMGFFIILYCLLSNFFDDYPYDLMCRSRSRRVAQNTKTRVGTGMDLHGAGIDWVPGYGLTRSRQFFMSLFEFVFFFITVIRDSDPRLIAVIPIY